MGRFFHRTLLPETLSRRVNFLGRFLGRLTLIVTIMMGPFLFGTPPSSEQVLGHTKD